MKKVFAIISLLVISVVSFAQISNLYPFTKEVVKTINGRDSIVTVTDSSLVIDRIYAGSLSGTMFHTDSLYVDGFTEVRLGAMATYRPTSWLSFGSWALVQVDGGAQPWSLQQYWMTLQPTSKLTLTFGSMASIPTEMRPHPVSGNGQFETWSEATIPGGGLGIKAKYQFTSDFQLAGGVVIRKGLPEYSARLTYKKFQLTGWYSTIDSTSGIAASLTHGRVFSTLVYSPDQTIADVLVITLSKKQGIKLYSDMGYSFVEKELVRGEWGLMKTFDSKWVDVLFGLGYRAKSLAGYLLIHF